MERIRFLDTTCTVQVIGNIYNNPSLLEKVYLTNEDFPNKFHKIVYGTLYNLYFNNKVTDFSENVILDYLENKPKAEAVFKSGGGIDFIRNCAENAEETGFNYYAERLQKMTLLRQFSKIGVDVSDILDEDNLIDTKKKEKQEEWLNNASLADISDRIQKKIDKVVNNYGGGSEDLSCQAAEGAADLIEELRQHPAYGLPFYDPVYTTVTMGARLGKFYLRSAPTGMGKAIPNYTVIPTPTGDKKVGDIKVGDYLFGKNGKPTKVLAIHPQPEKKEIYKITFSDGRIAECCEEHLWTYQYKGHSKWLERTESTKDLLIRSKGQFKSSGWKYRLSLCSPVEYPEKKYKIDPYIFGLILGDGSFRYDKNNKSFTFSSIDEYLPNKIGESLNCEAYKNSEYSYNYSFKLKNPIKGRINLWVEEILEDFPELWNAKSEDKFIPKNYLEGSIEQRYALLQGLMDTDGSIDKKTGRTLFTTISSKLRDDIIALVQSLGYIATYTIDKRKDKYTTGECYNIDLQLPKEEKRKIFNLPRKLEVVENYINNGKRAEHKDYIAITNIEPTGVFTEMTCFTVEAQDSLFLMNNFIVTHNTRMLVQDAAFLSCTEYYDSAKGGWVKNPAPAPTLFILTEQDRSEAQTLLLSFVCEVNESHILTGDYEEGEYERILRGIQILENSPLYLEFLPDFSLEDIERRIKYNIEERNATYICFDYIQSTMKILAEISNRTKVNNIREDQILFLLATKIKEIAVLYNVWIISSTQLSGDLDTSTPDQRLLRGSKAVGDKLDFGCHLLPLNDRDRDMLTSMQHLFSDGRIPDIKLAIYKNRRSPWNGIYLFGYKRLGVCRVDFTIATTWDYQIVQGLKGTNINVEKGAF